MSTSITIQKRSSIHGTAVNLPASKSISNRALIINAMTHTPSVLHNLSGANDTQLMLRLIHRADPTVDVEDAGTTMRFLTAYFAVTNQRRIITGTSRMKERPIGILVNALRSLGAEINYLEREGFPPLKTDGFGSQKTGLLKIRGDVSSQFISALMMVAPVLPHGLTLELEGKVGSKPYIDMTAALMKHFGVTVNLSGSTISIARQDYAPSEFTVESDWSGASYWFAFASLAEEADIRLPGLSLQSLQGDSAVADIMTRLGVRCEMQKDGMLRLTRTDTASALQWDFTHCPDLAQTVAVVCAAKGVTGTFTGMESLRIKETDRIAALQAELNKIGASLVEENSVWTLKPAENLPPAAAFHTYKDHRMAMAFAPLATKMDVTLDNPPVVRKSYPGFWLDLKEVGFATSM